MAESKVRRENYISLQGWMLTDLHLKGNELIIYACIYGFSQDDEQVFSGSLQYLADWTNSTRQGVMKCLKSLAEKGYILKNEKYINGVKFCEYRATKFTGVVNKVYGGGKQSLIGGMQQSLPNNLVPDNTADKIDDKKDIYTAIIDHLNAKAGTNYRMESKSTQAHINGRLNEGFTPDDFIKVIDKKCAEWLGTDYAKYLRPSTLFGGKFESYLNEPTKHKGNPNANMSEDDMRKRWDNLPGCKIT